MRVLASHGIVNRWLNPYNWLLNSHLERLDVTVQGAVPWRVVRGQGDILHLHWPDHVFNVRSEARARLAMRSLLHLVREGRQAGLKLVWTVHNLRAHEHRHAHLDGAFWDAFLAEVDGTIHLSEAGRAAAESVFPFIADRSAWVVPHGHYRDEYPWRLTRGDARRRLVMAPDAPTLAFVGRVRPYKNVPTLLDAFGALRDTRARAVITGAPASAGLRDEIIARATRDARVRLDLRHLRRQRLATVVAASDLVVLPYREILNSGTALLALSLDRPVLVPRLGALAELAAQVGDAWVRCYDGELTADVLGEALQWARTTPRAARAPLGRFSWSRIARTHRDAYGELLGGVFAPEAHAGDLPRRASRRAVAGSLLAAR